METINIKALVRMLGINEHTLRAWERRYRAIEPDRDENGRRLYSAKDVERLRLLSGLVDRGHTIGHIARLPTTQLHDLFSKSEQNLPLGSTVAQLPVNGFIDPLLKALSDFDLQKVSWNLQKARFHLSPRELVVELIAPVLAEVGQMIKRDQVGIAQEHALSALMRDVLGGIYQSLNPYDQSARLQAKSIGLTTREGDLHEFGILMSAILCALRGFRVHYFGPNLPAEDVVAASQKLNLDLVILGVSELPKRRELVDRQTFIDQLDQNLPRSIAIWVGGGGIKDLSKPDSGRKFLRIADLLDLEAKLHALQPEL